MRDITNEALKAFSKVLVENCGVNYTFELVELKGDKYVAMSQGDSVFGYLRANGTSMLGIMESIIKVALYGGSDRNYISPHTMYCDGLIEW